MKRLTYQDVAEAIATASCDNDRARSAGLLATYYAAFPPPETVTERRRILALVLRRHMDAAGVPPVSGTNLT